jgi:predicted transcriptional regulator
MKSMSDGKEQVEKFLLLLEETLDEKNLSVPQFAELMGVPKMTVYKWVRRESVMSLEKYYRALKVLGLESNIDDKDT